MWLSVSGGEECRRLGGGVGQVLGGSRPLVRLCGPASADTPCSAVQFGLGRMDAAGKGSKPAETEPHGKQDMEDFLHRKVLQCVRRVPAWCLTSSPSAPFSSSSSPSLSPSSTQSRLSRLV